MARAQREARAGRRFLDANDENDAYDVNHRSLKPESYARNYHTSTNGHAFMTPDHDSKQPLQERYDYEWHYQETPPAQIKHTQQRYRGDELADGFKTPEPDSRGVRRQTAATTATTTTASTAGKERGAGETQYQTAAEFAQSQYRRRNRLEKRLEELQKDVASLTMKLRSSSKGSTSTGHVSLDKPSAPAARTTAAAPLDETPLNPARANKGNRPPVQQTQRKLKPPSPVVKIKKNRLEKPRTTRSNLSEHSTTPTKGRLSSHVSVTTMRELHNVTTERDQLKFELEKTKRMLTSAEKKYEEALKAREAYEKLKAHCESLQESLDLSEKIRVRQKKLLQQLQQTQSQQQRSTSRIGVPSAPKTKESTRSSTVANPKKKAASHMNGNSTIHLNHTAHDMASRYSRQQHPTTEHLEYDILDALVNSSDPNATVEQRLFSRGEPATARPSRVRVPPPSNASKHRAGPTYADFDSLLQKAHSPHPYMTAKSGDVKQESNRISRRDQAEMSANSRRIRSKSQGPSATTHHPGKTKSSNHFLAPTQASLQRVQSQQRRSGDHRRPFI